MRSFRIGLSLCAAIAPWMTASAQDAPRVKEQVEVSGRRPAAQVLPDRTVYAIDHNLQSSSGTASDILRDLPSVEIDVQGAISLRGDRNVTVLIDGKPSALLSGSDALDQIPAESIERVEVITNPSAEFKAEGSGGIINIVMRKNAQSGNSGIVRANVGNNGRFNAAASGTTKLGPVKLGGGLTFRRDARDHAGDSERVQAGSLIRQSTSNKSRHEGAIARARAEMTINGSNDIALQLIGINFQTWSKDGEHNIAQAGLSEITSDRFGEGHRKRSITEVGLEYTHAFATSGEELKVEFQRGTDWGEERTAYTTVTAGQPDMFERWRSKDTENEMSYRADYVRPFAGGARLKAGYNYEMGRNSYDNLGEHRDTPDGAWLTYADYTNLFVVNQTVHAGYATFEDKFGKLDALLGLRLERTGIVADQRTMGSRVKNSYLGFFPSLHLTYDLADGQQLRASYSRRINRPHDHALNPSLEYRDAFNVSSGNPYLKPENTDSIELGYKYAADSVDTLLTAYYRKTRDGFTDVSRYISDGVLLTTTENLARSIRTGLEFTANADIGEDLSLQLSGNGYYDEINPGPTSLGAFRSGLAWSGKLGIDYKLTPDDAFQLSGSITARRLMAQGYRLPGFTANLGYRHSFSDSLSGVVTVSNLFDSRKDKTYLTSGVHEVSVRRHVGRILYVGFVYSFGGAKDGDRDGGNGDDNGGAEF